MKIQMMNDRQYFITLPNKIVKAKRWRKGDKLKVIINDKGELILKKIKNRKEIKVS